ncbi:MAG: hypothetical protein ACO34J_16425 [Prochlorothrix sp.]
MSLSEATPPKFKAQSLDSDPVELETEAKTDLPYFLQVLADLHAKIPDSEWEQIPSDLSKNFDHYLYGGPKDEE